MSDEAALLRAICDHPDDDTPRLVFADWLTEQGGPVNSAWANAIRAQIWDAQGLPDHPLKGRPLLFNSPYGLRLFFERAGVEVLGWEDWERGFPATAHGTFDALSAAWPKIAHRFPIRHIRMYDLSDSDLALFVRWPGLHPVRELRVTGRWQIPVAPDALAPLTECETLRGLETLDARYVELNDRTVLALLDSPNLANLKRARLELYRDSPSVSEPLKARLEARFGPDVFGGEEIPF
jgi:uncharacterized protein (TIGR02996 family)